MEKCDRVSAQELVERSRVRQIQERQRNLLFLQRPAPAGSARPHGRRQLHPLSWHHALVSARLHPRGACGLDKSNRGKWRKARVGLFQQRSRGICDQERKRIDPPIAKNICTVVVAGLPARALAVIAATCAGKLTVLRNHSSESASSSASSSTVGVATPINSLSYCSSSFRTVAASSSLFVIASVTCNSQAVLASRSFA